MMKCLLIQRLALCLALPWHSSGAFVNSNFYFLTFLCRNSKARMVTLGAHMIEISNRNLGSKTCHNLCHLVTFITSR